MSVPASELEHGLPIDPDALTTGPEWRVIRLPAIAEKDDPLGRAEGDALWRKRYPEAALADIKHDVGSYVWSALYQQAPSPAAGNMFKRASFRTFLEPTIGIYHLQADDTVGEMVKAADCVRFQTCDLAASEKLSADYTVVATWDLTPKKKLLLVDLVREHVGPGDILSFLIRNYTGQQGAQPLYLGVEEAFYGMYAIADLRKAGVTVRKLKADADKVTRAIPASARLEVGDIWWRRDAAWRPEFEKELLSFPVGSHDDQVDVLAYAARRIAVSGPIEAGPKVMS